MAALTVPIVRSQLFGGGADVPGVNRFIDIDAAAINTANPMAQISIMHGEIVNCFGA
jgi:hypothetical protein